MLRSFDVAPKLSTCIANDIPIVEFGPTPFAGAVLQGVSSVADVDHIHSLGWSMLMMRSNSANSKVIFVMSSYN